MEKNLPSVGGLIKIGAAIGAAGIGSKIMKSKM